MSHDLSSTLRSVRSRKSLATLKDRRVRDTTTLWLTGLGGFEVVDLERLPLGGADITGARLLGTWAWDGRAGKLIVPGDVPVYHHPSLPFKVRSQVPNYEGDGAPLVPQLSSSSNSMPPPGSFPPPAFGFTSRPAPPPASILPHLAAGAALAPFDILVSHSLLCTLHDRLARPRQSPFRIDATPLPGGAGAVELEAWSPPGVQDESATNWRGAPPTKSVREQLVEGGLKSTEAMVQYDLAGLRLVVAVQPEARQTSADANLTSLVSLRVRKTTSSAPSSGLAPESAAHLFLSQVPTLLLATQEHDTIEDVQRFDLAATAVPHEGLGRVRTLLGEIVGKVRARGKTVAFLWENGALRAYEKA